MKTLKELVRRRHTHENATRTVKEEEEEEEEYTYKNVALRSIETIVH